MQYSSIEKRRLVGGALCLDFANSVDWDSDGAERPAHTDALGAPADLETWGRRLGIVRGDDLEISGRELAAARDLRHALHRVFRAEAQSTKPPAEALELVGKNYAEAVRSAELRCKDGWRFEWQPDDPRRVRFAVAVSAIHLLLSPLERARIRICPGNNCGWLFIDTSGRRRWCSMEVCGSRAKMRRLYERRNRSSRPAQKRNGRNASNDKRPSAA
jgi:predicted RNA-binding Zn ribbon-like protein